MFGIFWLYFIYFLQSLRLIIFYFYSVSINLSFKNSWSLECMCLDMHFHFNINTYISKSCLFFFSYLEGRSTSKYFIRFGLSMVLVQLSLVYLMLRNVIVCVVYLSVWMFSLYLIDIWFDVRILVFFIHICIIFLDTKVLTRNSIVLLKKKFWKTKIRYLL